MKTKAQHDFSAFRELASAGYYIRREKGIYRERGLGKGIKHEAYSVTKDCPDGTRSINCLLNKEAARILRNEGVMMTKTVDNIVWINRPYSMEFIDGDKEPRKITFHE